MERENYDEIPVIMYIRPYMFEPLALSINEENASTSSKESEAEANSNP